MSSMHRMFRPVYIAAALAVALFAGLGASAWAANGTADTLPRCVNDDYNDGSQDRCWSESEDGVFVLDSSDTVISINPDEDADVTVAPCSAWADTQYPEFDGPIVPGVCADEDGKLIYG